MASLAEALYALPADRLRALVQTRKVALNRLSPTPTKRQLVQYLATELSKPPSVLNAVAQCNARELRLLQLLLSGETGKEMPWPQVVEAAGGSALAASLDAVLTRLEELGLAFRWNDGVLLPDAIRAHIPAALPDRFPLRKCLAAYDNQTLKRIFTNLELGKEAGTKNDTVEKISHHLLDGKPGLRLKQPLDAEEIAVLEYLAQTGGWATALDVASAVMPEHSEDFFRYDWQNRWKQGRERNAVDTLLARGILYVVAHGYAYNLYLVIPGDLLRTLTGESNTAFWTAPPLAPEPVATPPSPVAQHTTLLRDVVSLLAFLSAQEAVRTSTGHIHKTSLKNLARALSLPDERYASFLYALCRSAELIAAQGEKQVYTVTPRGESWLTGETDAQTGALFAAWRDGYLWAEMYNDALMKNGDYRPTERVVEMRRATLEQIATGDREEFLDLSSLADALAFRHPMLLAQSAVMGPDLVASPTVFMRRLVGECLFWLGLVELGYATAEKSADAPAPTKARSAKSGSGSAALSVRGQIATKSAAPTASSYRLTPIGRWLLGVPNASQPPAEPREDQFIVQANAEIFVPPYLEPATLYHLLRLTDVNTKEGVSSTVRLTRESIRRALDGGETPNEVIAFLQKRARTGIPQNIEYLIREVADRHGHIHVGTAQMYLRVDSPLLLQELKARREMKPYFVRELSDTVALLQSDDVEKILRELRKLGYLPISDDTPKERKGNAPPARPAAAPFVWLASSSPKTSSKRTAGADTLIDWTRIALEDEKPWNAPAKAAETSRSVDEPAPPGDVTRDRIQIGVLMAQAAQNRQCVEIAYKKQNEAVATRRIIEPHVVVGDFVSAFNRTDQNQGSFNIKRMLWARPLDQSFDD